MRALAMIVPAVLALAGCDAANRYYGTDFRPVGGDGFLYVANADSAAYPVDSAQAESTRRAWLEQYLSDNALCPKGYQITERTAVKVSSGLIADSWRVHYRGRCKS